ncbi:MAG: glycogen debranching N-terminal domain-containing protein [Solirubrobacteraceae bacterium]
MTSAGEPEVRAGQAPPGTDGDGHAASPLRELEGAPDVLAEAREELLALKSGAMFVCARRDGDIRPARASGEGLYIEDTRHLSELRLTVGGLPPVPLSSVMESGHYAVINATNPVLGSAVGVPVAQETLNVRRTVLIADRLFYRVRVRNFAAKPVVTIAEISLAADFADVFEVRGLERTTEGRVLEPTHDEDRVRFGYVAADGEHRETLVELEPSPAHVRVDGGRVHVAWNVRLDVRESISLWITVTPSCLGGADAEPTAARAGAALESAHAGWVGECAQVTTDNELFDRLIDASVRDLHALMMPVGADQLPAAGIPWYVAPFGRDSLLSSCESLMINPKVARGTLLVLAGLQAQSDEGWRDAEPGKILHELRTGELARTGHIPHTPYYGTVDATPLFLMVAGGYYRWTLDLDTMRQLRPALDDALRWIDEWGDRDGDGFIEYERRAPAGLINHGWKDSHDCIVHADGAIAEGPIALVEVQGYVYEAKLRIADVYEALGDVPRADRLRSEAGELRAAFNEAFWDPDEGFFVLALDGRKRQVRSVTSNPAHCLYCGIVDDDKAAMMAERLMAADMFSGWGIRTLSGSSPAYNPMSYHNGSIWPHDNAIAAAGLKRYGFDAATNRIAAGLFDVASGARDFRLPELFCGFQRDGSRAIVAYPVACIPQAWAATAPFMLLQAMLGISAHAPNNRLTVDRPRLPDWLGAVEIRGIRVGNSKVSLAFRQTGPSTGFSLLEQQGNVRVTMTT